MNSTLATALTACLKFMSLYLTARRTNNTKTAGAVPMSNTEPNTAASTGTGESSE